jgi:uncharacterized protein
MSDHVHDSNRRQFIVGGLAGLASSTLAPGGLLADDAAGKRAEVPTRALGKTGLVLPLVSMGVMNADNPNLVAAALDGGIRMLDTAHYYQRGRNEEMVGSVIKDRPRDSFVLATKARPTTVDRSHVQDDAKATAETKESFLQKVDLSLQRLRTDHVDILYLHSAKGRDHVLDEMVLDAMQTLKQQGKVRFTGVSTHRNQAEVMRAAVESGIYEVILTAYNFRSRDADALEEAMAFAASRGLGVVAMKTQAGVFLDDERTQKIPMKPALRWALRHDFVHTSIPGFTTFDQLEEDLEVMANPLMTPEDERALLPLADRVAGLYCQQCESCLRQCAAGVDLPTLMRGYMYARGYRNLAAAKDAVRSLRLEAVPCVDCDACTVRCPQGIDVRRRALEVARLEALPDAFLA